MFVIAKDWIGDRFSDDLDRALKLSKVDAELIIQSFTNSTWLKDAEIIEI